MGLRGPSVCLQILSDVAMRNPCRCPQEHSEPPVRRLLDS